MLDWDKPARGDEDAELRLRVVFTLFDNGSLWPVYGPRPNIVRSTMATEVQAGVDAAIDEAIALATVIEDRGPEGRFYALHPEVREWLTATSTVPAGDGLSNADRLHQAFRAADCGGFRPHEFSLLWQQLRTRPECR